MNIPDSSRSKRFLLRVLRAPGLWLCNLGYHKARKAGRISGHRDTFRKAARDALKTSS